MKIKHLAISALTCMMTAAIGSSYSQEGPLQKVQNTTINSVINYAGWEIPALAQSKIVSSSEFLLPYKESSLLTRVTLFKPKREIIIDVPVHSLWANTLYVSSRTVAIKEVRRFDLKDRTFCYLARVVQVLKNMKTDAYEYTAESGLLYYDEDGDGTFEKFEEGGAIYPFNPRLPKWLLEGEK